MLDHFLRMEAGRMRRLRLAAALLAGDASRLGARADEVRELLEPFDPDVVAELWNHERVLPLATARARGIGLEARAWTEAEQDAHARGRAAGAMHDLVARQVTAAFAAAGIDSVVLKGPPMAGALHGDPVLRQASGDVDLLVARDDLWTASDVLVGLGWQAPTDRLPAGGLPWHHLTHASPGGAPEIELHWRIHWYETAQGTDELLRAADRSGELPTPSPVHVLQGLLLGHLRDGAHGLRLPADIAAWWDRYGADHGEAAQAAITSGRLARPLGLAARAAAELVGTPAPSASPPGWRERLVTTLAVEDRPMTERTLTTRATLVDLVAAPPDRRRARWNHAWLRDAGRLRARHPRLPAAAVVPVRAARVLRTGLQTARLARDRARTEDAPRADARR